MLQEFVDVGLERLNMQLGRRAGEESSIVSRSHRDKWIGDYSLFSNFYSIYFINKNWLIICSLQYQWLQIVFLDYRGLKRCNFSETTSSNFRKHSTYYILVEVIIFSREVTSIHPSNGFVLNYFNLNNPFFSFWH